MLSALRTTSNCCARCPAGPLFRAPSRSQQGFRWQGRGNRRLDPPGASSTPEGNVSLARPVFFTGTVGVTCYLGASIWQYEEMRARMVARAKQAIPLFSQSKHKMGTWRQHVNIWWNNLTEGQRVFAPILLGNVMVFLAWRVPKFRPTMMTYFSSNPASRAVCWPMLLSTFSHYSAFHLAANMYVLHSFSTGAVSALGKEQFLGLYLGAGVASSLASHVYKVMIRSPGMSIGASGAIMAILGYVCTAFPDTRLSIIFIPDLNFTAESAIKALIAFDTAGAILRWKFFDHAAHLGGALCGIAWGMWGHKLWMKREPIVTWWHEKRGSVTK